jgi:hypothetical protein
MPIQLMRVVTLLALIYPLCLLHADLGSAQIDPWEFEVYPYATESRGVIELESDNAVVPDGHRHSGGGKAKGTYPSQGMWYTPMN